MSKSPFKVLKLKSGEDIIAKLIQSTEKQIKVERPMLVKIMHYVETSGMKKETVVLVDWLKLTVANSVQIPRDHILQIFDSNPELIRAYNMQKRIDDTPFDIHRIKQDMDTPPRGPEPPSWIMKIVQGKFNLEDIEEEEQFDADDIRDMLEEAAENAGLKRKTSEDHIIDDNRKNSKDYGESYLDWSPNLDDYLT